MIILSKLNSLLKIKVMYLKITITNFIGIILVACDQSITLTYKHFMISQCKVSRFLILQTKIYTF